MILSDLSNNGCNILSDASIILQSLSYRRCSISHLSKSQSLGLDQNWNLTFEMEYLGFCRILSFDIPFYRGLFENGKRKKRGMLSNIAGR